MQVSVISTRKELLAIEELWNDMIHDSQFNEPFYSWAWYRIWWDHFGKDKELYVITVKDSNGRIMAIAPLMKVKIWLKWFKVTEIRFIDNSINPRNNILFRKGLKGFMDPIIDFLSKHREEWDLLNFKTMEKDMPYISHLYKCLAHHNLRAIRIPGRRSPYIQINGDFQSYMMNNFNSKQRNNILRRVKTIFKKENTKAICYTDQSDMDTAVDLAFQISKSSWKGDIRSDMSNSEDRKKFYINISQYLAKNKNVAIWVLVFQDKTIAVQYQIKSKEKVYLIINDFDQKYQRFAPGIVLLYRVIENCHDEKKLAEFDFSGDNYEYKLKWATGLRRHMDLQIFSNHFFSLFLFLMKDKVLPIIRKIKNVTITV